MFLKVKQKNWKKNIEICLLYQFLVAASFLHLSDVSSKQDQFFSSVPLLLFKLLKTIHTFWTQNVCLFGMDTAQTSYNFGSMVIVY